MNRLADSNIFFTHTNIDNTNRINYSHIGVRELLKDTIINNKSFKKYQKSTFREFKKNKIHNVYFESFRDSCYEKMNNNLEPIHKINIRANNEQTGILFGKKGTIEMVFDTIDDGTKKIIRYKSSPRIFFLKSEPNKYIRVRPDLKVIEIETSGSNQTTHMLGSLFTKLSDGIKNTKPISNYTDLSIGDEIQLVYKNIKSNQKTGEITYVNSKLISSTYIKDTTTNKGKKIYLETIQYSYLTERTNKKIISVVVTPSGLVYNDHFYAFKKYNPDFRISDTPESHILCQGYTNDTLGDTLFPRIITYNSSSHFGQYQLLPYFPIPIFYTLNQDIEITYIKKHGKEFGNKRKTENSGGTNISFDSIDSTPIFEVISFDRLSNNRCEITYSLNETATIKWILRSKKNIDPIELVIEEKNTGINTQSLQIDEVTYNDEFDIAVVLYWKEGRIYQKINF